MRRYTPPPKPSRQPWIWTGLLALWGLFLSGLVSEVTGSPGALQAMRLQDLLKTRTAELSTLEAKVHNLDQDRLRLEQNAAVQEREVRRVLGYAAPGELIFDFSGGTSPR